MNYLHFSYDHLLDYKWIYRGGLESQVKFKRYCDKLVLYDFINDILNDLLYNSDTKALNNFLC